MFSGRVLTEACVKSSSGEEGKNKGEEKRDMINENILGLKKKKEM